VYLVYGVAVFLNTKSTASSATALVPTFSPLSRRCFFDRSAVWRRVPRTHCQSQDGGQSGGEWCFLRRLFCLEELIQQNNITNRNLVFLL
jgi:hypothetical protein